MADGGKERENVADIGSSGSWDQSERLAFTKIKSNLIKPAVDREKDKKLISGYIPGLHIPGQNFPELPEIIKPDYLVENKSFIDELIRDFNSGQKNPISIVLEYCAKMNLTATFEERPVHKLGLGRIGCFGNVCIIEGVEYPMGAGNNKKLAKTEAAKEAFKIIMKKGYIKAEDKELTASSSTTTTEKSPISLVYELCKNKNWTVTFDLADVKTEHGYRCDGIINGSMVATKFSFNKNDAKKLVAEHILRVILSCETNSDMTSHVTKRPRTHFDNVSGLVINKVVSLASARKCNFTYLALAGFVIKRDPSDEGEVVAIGTGNGCIHVENLKTTGRVLMDCHAEIVARRALLKWFYGQLKNLSQRKSSIFEGQLSKEGKIKLKEMVSLHLYLSSNPCGDASVLETRSPTVVSDEEWRCMGRGEHTPNMGEQLGRIVYKKSCPSVLLGNEFSMMSCSDKILKWNILGVQGNLLSHFVEPIYINSITFGDKFNFGNCTRALCCRIDEGINMQLPTGFHLRHPFMGRVSVYKAMPLANPDLNLSVNWCADDHSIEFVDQYSGLEMEISPFHTGPYLSSRLSKMGFFHRFIQLCQTFQVKVPFKSNIFGDQLDSDDDDDDDYDDLEDDDDDVITASNKNENNKNNNNKVLSSAVGHVGCTYGSLKFEKSYITAKQVFKKHLKKISNDELKCNNKRLDDFMRP